MKKLKSGSENIRSVLWKIQARFELAGLENPRLLAELVLSEALQIPRSELYLAPEQMVPAQAYAKIRSWTKALLAHKPFAYIIKKAWFREIELEVNPKVMIPRPETELLVEEAIKLIKSRPELKKILDLGTGSGAIILSLAKELKELDRELKFFASDLSLSALRLAKKNAQKLGVQDQIEFRWGNLFQPFRKEKFHLIICNPPYIPSADLKKLMPEVKDYEPRLALDGGKQGLTIIRKLLSQAPFHLYPEGWLLLEIGLGQAKKLKKSASPKLTLCNLVKDYQGIDRIALFQMGS